MLIPFAVFLISFILLLWSGKLLPNALARLAELLRLSEFITAFILASIATSIPELFVGISSAFQDVTDLPVGNVIGSNVLNLTIIVGVPALFASVVVSDGKISRQNYWLIFLIAFLPIFLMADGLLSRIDGLLLLIVFALYFYKLFHDGEHFRKVITEEGEALATSDAKPTNQSLSSRIREVLHLAGIFAFGVAVLLGSAYFLVWASKFIVTEYFGSDFFLFGLLFVAIGTTLPELVFGIRAVIDGFSSAMLGNVLGSVAFNAAAVLGITAIIRPIGVEFNRELLTSSLFLFAAFLLFYHFVYSENRLSRKEGFFLILVYFLFLIIII